MTMTAIRPRLVRLARATQFCTRRHPGATWAAPSRPADSVLIVGWTLLQRWTPALWLPDRSDVDLVGVLLSDHVRRRQQLIGDRLLGERQHGRADAPPPHCDGALRHRCRDPAFTHEPLGVVVVVDRGDDYLAGLLALRAQRLRAADRKQ